MYKSKRENVEKVMEVFFSNSNSKYHIRELARITKLNPNTIVSITNDLVKQGLIIKEEKKYLVEVSLNEESEKVKWKKRLYNLNKFYDSGIIEYLNESFNHPESIILYGSYSNGTNTKKSDIDIFVISKLKKEVNLSKFERILGSNIHLLVLPLEKISKELINGLSNGIVVSGYLNNG